MAEYGGMHSREKALCPEIRRVEDLPLHTPGGTKRMEQKSTSILPMSARSAKRVLEKPGETLLASKVRRTRTFSGVVADQTDGKKQTVVADAREGTTPKDAIESSAGGREAKKRRAVADESEAHVKEATRTVDRQDEESDLKDMVVALMARVARLESLNPDLYAQLMITRSLAVANILHTFLGMLDEAVLHRLESLDPGSRARVDVSVAPRGVMPERTITYSTLWWLVYNQTLYEPNVPLHDFWLAQLKVVVPKQAALAIPPNQSRQLKDLAVDIVKPRLLDPAEFQVLQMLGFPASESSGFLFKYIGLYLSCFKPVRNKNMHLFENMLQHTRGQWQQESASARERRFLINQALGPDRLRTLQEVLADIIEHADDLGTFHPFGPVVKQAASQFKKMVDLELAKPPGWDELSKDQRFWMSPCGWYYRERETGHQYAYSDDVGDWVRND